MFPYVFIALLVMNIILLIFVLMKGSKQKENTFPEPIFEKKIDHEKLILRELSELRKSFDQLSIGYRQELLQMRKEYQELFEKAKQNQKVDKVENLFITDRYKEIFDLHDQGLSEEQIARELGKGIGEISLILQLASKKQN